MSFRGRITIFALLLASVPAWRGLQPARAAVVGPSTRRLGVTTLSTAEAYEASTCGASDQPDCPLQSWMKANAVTALRASNFAGLERAFARLETMSPPGYDRWPEISRSGRAAAAAANLDGCRQACQSCHDAFREKYRDERRPAALP